MSDSAPPPPKSVFVNRELSWLDFNDRVLQEAEDASVPLMDRLAFLAIFSSNLDEFFRVRVAILRTLLREGKTPGEVHPARLLRQIYAEVTEQQERFGRILERLREPLAARGLVLTDERHLSPEQRRRVWQLFESDVAEHLHPVVLGEGEGEEAEPFLENKGIYLVARLWPHKPDGDPAPRYALVEVPKALPRFVTLPADADTTGGPELVLFLDDVIRVGMDPLFPDDEVGEAYAVKLSRDAELYLEDESGPLAERLRNALSKRDTGLPTRFLYDQHAPFGLLAMLERRLGLAEEDFVPGGRYHNLHDLFGFPTTGHPDDRYAPLPPLAHPAFEHAADPFAVIREKDRVLHLPYQSFQTVTDWLERAAADDQVEAIYATLYRVGEGSAVASALAQAARSGKRVTACVELKARFDEPSNLKWADRLAESGAHVLHSKGDLKVHAKLLLVERREPDAPGGLRRYAFLSTGNFNEKTARIYADHGLFTADPRLTDEVRRVFDFLDGTDDAPTFEHLLVAPFTLRSALEELIECEAERGGRVVAKMNALEDARMAAHIAEASRRGLPFDLVIRGISILRPGVEGRTENVRVRSIVDRFLEHARVWHFAAQDRLYLASADWMARNLDRRVEVAFPLYDADVRRELLAMLDLQLRDDRKARVLTAAGGPGKISPGAGAPVQAQADLYAAIQEGSLCAEKV
jgi:polyphosphate kinase